MKILVLGLGSMGKRRIRNLQRIGGIDIGGFDIRADRRDEAASRYGVPTYDSLSKAFEHDYDAVIISLPPDLHTGAATECAKRGKATFIEASVVLDGMHELADAFERAGLVAMPSCTMRYFPGPRAIEELLAGGTLGRPLFWRYHTGQYLLDWHPWEPISEYYVSRRQTGGCREIVAFELAWLTKVFGDVAAVRGRNMRVGSLKADIDDLYTAELYHESEVIGQLAIDVLSRPAVRDFCLVADAGTLHWDGIANTLRYSVRGTDWKDIALDVGHPEKGYLNPEEPYEAEIRDFLNAVERNSAPSYTLRHDIRVLETLHAIERDSAHTELTAIRDDTHAV